MSRTHRTRTHHLHFLKPCEAHKIVPTDREAPWWSEPGPDPRAGGWKSRLSDCNRAFFTTTPKASSVRFGNVLRFSPSDPEALTEAAELGSGKARPQPVRVEARLSHVIPAHPTAAARSLDQKPPASAGSLEESQAPGEGKQEGAARGSTNGRFNSRNQPARRKPNCRPSG